jgi:predicted kinase
VQPGLIVLAGLPGTGKSTIAVPLARELRAPYLRIDSIEQALVDSGELVDRPKAAGYIAGYALVRDQLGIGITVVVECVNPLKATRDAWKSVADQQKAWLLDVELVCSEPDLHRARVENRDVGIPGLALPTWQQVLDRRYEQWDRDRLVIDTAVVSAKEAVDVILQAVTVRNSRTDGPATSARSSK